MYSMLVRGSFGSSIVLIRVKKCTAARCAAAGKKNEIFTVLFHIRNSFMKSYHT